MTEVETKKIIAYIITAYPNYKPDNMKYTVDFWTEMFSDCTYNQVYAGLKAYIASDTSGFAPSIGAIRNCIQKISAPATLSGMEAWSLVSAAIRNGYYGAEAEFEKLPEDVQEAVGSPSQLRNWAITDNKSIENVVQSNFLRTYETVCKRNEEKRRMSPDVRALIDKVNENRPKLYVKADTPAIEQKRVEGVPMPESVRERLDRMFED